MRIGLGPWPVLAHGHPPATQAAYSGSGYLASKVAAERAVRAAMDAGQPATILRPSMITGHSVTGACNPTDYVSRYLASTLRLGTHPHGPSPHDLADLP